MKNRFRGSLEVSPSRLEPLEERNLFAATPITYIDGDGTSVKISLSGNGAMVLNGADLAITGTDQGSRLTITATGGTDKRTTLNSISINGAIRTITAKTTDLTGDLSILGSVRTLDLGNFLPGAQKTITIGGNAAATAAKITIIRATDLSIDSGTPISALYLTDWDDTDNNDLIEAPKLSKVDSKEDFAPGGIIISDQERKGYLGKILTRGTMAGAWYVDGNAAGFHTDFTTSTFKLNARGKISTIRCDVDFLGSLAAYNIGTVTVYGSIIGATMLAGVDLGTDMVLGGTGEAADLFFTGDFTKVYARNNAIASTFGAGLDPNNGVINDGDDFIRGKKGSVFSSIHIAGLADQSCFFAAGKFGNARVGQTTLDPNGDPRFLLPTLEADEDPPVILAQLRTNTGDPNDNITSDYTIIGRVTDLGTVKSFRFGVDDEEIVEFDSILSLIEPDGTFELLRSAIERANKGPLTVGAHTINFYAKDEIGNTAAIVTVAFVFAP